METEVENKIPFLDILITSSEKGDFHTSVYRKNTFTGLLLNFNSFTPLKYKLGLIKTLIDRVFNISFNWLTFHAEILNVENLLSKNAYPSFVVDKEINNVHIQTNLSINDNTWVYSKLPYTGRYSGYTQNKITHLCKKLCKSIKIKFAFSSPNVCSYFSTKGKMPNTLRSSVVYKFKCANCNVSYVGETYRHFNVRIKEHLTSHSTNIFLHLKRNEICKSSCDESCFKVTGSDNSRFRLKSDESCFKVTGSDNSRFRLKIKEALHLKFGYDPNSINKLNM